MSLFTALNKNFAVVSAYALDSGSLSAARSLHA